MNRHITTAALVLASLPVAAQTTRTGVSNPDQAPIVTTDDNAQAPANTDTGRRPLTAAKPSAATPATTAPAPATATDQAYGPYVPYKGATASTAVAATNDVDGQIVTSVPEVDGELREGTLLNVRMEEDLSTESTQPGTKFTAEVMEPVEKDGKVIIPIGSILNGQVTEVHAGHRISGSAAMHLEPRNVTLPDGTEYVLHAQLIDTSRSDFNVNNEGTLKLRDRGKETLAVMSLATGSGAVAGAMVGGGVGAVVGAGLGAGVSTYLWLKEERQATLKKDVRLVFSLTTPMELVPLHASAGSTVSMNSGAGPALKAAPVE